MSIELGLTMGTDGGLLETGSVTSRGKAGSAGSTQGAPSGFLALLAQFDTVSGDGATPLGGKDADPPTDPLADGASPASDTTLTLTDPASLIAQMQTALAGQDPATNPALALPVPPAVPATTTPPGATAAQNAAALLAGGQQGSGQTGLSGLAGTGRAGMAPSAKAGTARVAAQAGSPAGKPLGPLGAGGQPAAATATGLGAAAAAATAIGQAGAQTPGQTNGQTVGDPASAGLMTALAAKDGSQAPALSALGDAATAKEGGAPASAQDVVARLSQTLAARAQQPAAPAELAQAGAKSQVQALGVGAADGETGKPTAAKPGRGSDKHGPTGVTLDAVLRADKAGEGAGSAGGAGLVPTAVESFRQLVASAKGDRPAEAAAASAPVAGVGDRTASMPSGVWDASAHAARAVSDSAAVTAAAMPAAAYGTTEQQVADQVSMWVTQNVQSAELKLDALGKDPVEVSISLSGNEAQVQFRSDHAETRDLLTRAAADLDKSLQREGLVLSSVSVATSNQGQQDGARDPAQNAQAQTVGRAWQRGGGGDPVAQGVNLTGTVRPTRGAVDLFV